VVYPSRQPATVRQNVAQYQKELGVGVAA